MSHKILLITHSFISICFIYAASTVDQSQTGDLNVHVNLKDVRIIALMKSDKEEYVDYDYAYDYSEMTIKPQNGTTLKPPLNLTTDTMNDNATETTTQLNVETTLPNKNASIHPSLGDGPPTILATTLTPNTDAIPLTLSTTLNPILHTELPVVTNTSIDKIECKKGFVTNKKGECELKLPTSSTNALLKLVKLSQKLKIRREH